MTGGRQPARAPVSGWAGRQLTDLPWRMVAVARPGTLALVVALVAAAGDFAEPPWWLLALSVVVLAAGLAEWLLSQAWAVAAAEMFAVALVVGNGLLGSYLGLPYLLVPALAGGLAGGVLGAVGCTLVAAGGLAAGAALDRNGPFDLSTYLGLIPWLVLVLAMGLVGAFIGRQQRARSEDLTRYAAAYRLLSELRVVSRRLSGGLDAVSLADGVLAEVTARLPTRRAALLASRDGGELLPLARRGDDPRWLTDIGNDRLVLEALTRRAPTSAYLGRRGHRIVLPLRVGARTTGVVVADVPGAVMTEELESLTRSTDQGALRLETALLFDEVREIATREERQRLAREIHDGVAQEIASLGYLVDDLQARAKGADLRSLAITLRQEVSRILSDLRYSIFDLRSEVPADAGLGTSLARYARQIGAQTGLRVHLINDEDARKRLQPEIEAELLRVGQEAINNVRKHAKAQNLWVSVLLNPPAARIRVADDGIGVRGRGSDRYGFEIMAERSKRVGATLRVGERPEGGTVVDVSLGRSNGKV
ncbi:MAG: ATPase [Jiangellaceae bacterium]|nr:ATPase [Jiangellaceae bacterium]